MDQENRVVVLIDMDCFYCQVEEKLDPELKGKPIAVVQYNPWKGGGIIAVNYVARAMGVTRHMRGDEAKEKCPEIQLPSVPCQRGKADTTKYRDAGREVAKVLQRFTPLLERASVDEAYLDITVPVQDRLKSQNINTELMPNTYSLGYDSIDQFISDVNCYGNDSIDFDQEHAKKLLVGAVIVSEIRAAVFEETGYSCSAGIAHNKILAKLVCGMNKPNKQTILPKHCINILYKTLSLKKVKNLGGKFGDTVCEVLKISSMGELQTFSEKDLQARFDEKNGTWLFNIARGIDLEPVQARFNSKSIGCCKQLRGKSALHDLESLRKWLKDLGDEIEDRLEKDALEINRTPKQMVVSFSVQLDNGRDMSSSRSYNFVCDDELCGDLFCSKALELVLESAEGAKCKDGEPNRKLKAPIKFLGISVGKFEDHSETKKTRKILDYFGAGPSNASKTKDIIKQDEIKDVTDDRNSNKIDGKEYIMQKFFQVTDKVKNNEEIAVNKESTKRDPNAVLEASLAKQESFFAKFLNGTNKTTVNSEENIDRSEEVRAMTPLCNIVNRGEDSNDTEYSSSTINMEINKSIALFEDDPEDVVRVSSMRELLNSTGKETLQPEPSTVHKEPEKTKSPVLHNNPSPKLQNFECPECKKVISVNRFEEHSDYHLALKLREEERQQVRKEIRENKEKNQTKKTAIKEDLKRRKPEEQNKNESTSSISSFLVKLNDNVPTETCSECGKKVAVEKWTEHLDFHEAQKLNRELNKKSAPCHFTGNSMKRKRKTVSPVKKPKMPCNSRSIDSFFR